MNLNTSNTCLPDEEINDEVSEHTIINYQVRRAAQ